MRKVETETGTQLKPEERAYFGGKYSLWERVKMGGNGSSKILYLAGIDAFDRLQRGVAGEAAFVSFELFKNGLILRLNNNQRHSCVGARLSDIDAIRLTAYRIEIKQRRLGKVTTKIVHRGELEIVEAGETSKFSIITSEFDAITRFFQKKELVDKLYFSISSDPPEKDYGHLLEIFNQL